MKSKKQNPKNPESEKFFSGIAPLWPVKLVFSICLLSLALFFSFHHPPRQAFLWTGILLVVAGSVTELSHYRMLKVKAKELGAPKRLVMRGGLLQYIRHPMYLGDVVMAFGLGFLSGTIGLVAAVMFVPVVMGLCVQEDKMMRAKFVEDFSSWEKSSKRLFPFIW